MVNQAKLQKMQLRQSYRNVWHSDLCSTMIDDCPCCCLSVFCAPCVSYSLRKRALYNDMSRYICCAGYFPCSGKCGERECPELCLATEVFCCFSNSVASTRFLLQDEFNIQTTGCDNCIIGFMFCLNQVACICSIIACLVGSEELSDASDILSCLADLVYCSVCACMQTQHKIEMDKRDGKFGPPPVMAAPPVQQMSRLDNPYPPQVGKPPEQSYYGPNPNMPPPGPDQGYPPYPAPAPQPGYPVPPPQPQGYAPGSYPPPQNYPAGNYPPPGYPFSGYPTH